MHKDTLNHHEHHHGHGHGKGHGHHCHHHGHCHEKSSDSLKKGKILVLRPQSGISGDMLLSGLAMLTNTDNKDLYALFKKLHLDIDTKIEVNSHVLNGITGYKATIDIPHEHAHRNLSDIKAIIDKSSMTDKAKEYAISAFSHLAEAEAKVHAKEIDEVHFHEVGALDSIIDTCICASLFDKLAPDHFICGALPVADGSVMCAHGLLSTPAPAVMHLLHGMQITSSEGKGEMLTPTAISLLKAFNASFGNWCQMVLEEHYIVYGSRIIPNIPNGALFALGNNK